MRCLSQPGSAAADSILANHAISANLCRMKNIQNLTREEYLEEIRKIRSNPPEMTREEFWKQYEEMRASRGPGLPQDKPERSGAGRKQPAIA